MHSLQLLDSAVCQNFTVQLTLFSCQYDLQLLWICPSYAVSCLNSILLQDINFHPDGGSPAGYTRCEGTAKANKHDLAIAEQAKDEVRTAHLRRCLEELHSELVQLRMEKNILLQRQAPGQHCLPCYIVTPFG